MVEQALSINTLDVAAWFSLAEFLLQSHLVFPLPEFLW